MPLPPSSSTPWCLNCCKNTAIGITLACAMQATATPAILLARLLAAISIRALTRFRVSGTCRRAWGEHGKSLENGRRVVGDLRRKIRLRNEEYVGTVVTEIYNLYHHTFNRILTRPAVSEHQAPCYQYIAHGLAAPARATALIISTSTATHPLPPPWLQRLQQCPLQAPHLRPRQRCAAWSLCAICNRYLCRNCGNHTSRGWLSLFQNGNGPIDPTSTLWERSYCYHLDATDDSCPIVPNFRQWTYLHDHAPPHWQHLALDSDCRVSI
ncbi:hypothetical protein IG631_23254 [Alternaria alternata]|nr:hypothetical protein IG631_23254 [Alternaria alternata]